MSVTRLRLLALTGLLAVAPAWAARTPIDQVPMYGGMDRTKIPELRQADEDLVQNGIKGFGSREKAAEAWFSVGWQYYQKDDLANAMRRFNQAWLFNADDPKPYWGFAMVLHDQNKVAEAEKMMGRAFALGFRLAAFLADYGRISTLATVADRKMSPKTKADYLGKSDAMYALAVKADPQYEYIYGSWATAMYWRGDYVAAWEKVRKQRQLGGQPNPKFLRMLTGKMPEPAQ